MTKGKRVESVLLDQVTLWGAVQCHLLSVFIPIMSRNEAFLSPQETCLCDWK